MFKRLDFSYHLAHDLKKISVIRNIGHTIRSIEEKIRPKILWGCPFLAYDTLVNVYVDLLVFTRIAGTS